MSECQSPPGNMPAIWHVSFRVDSDGIRPLCQSRFGHLLVNLDSYVLYHNELSYIMITRDFLCIRCLRASKTPHEAGRANKPTPSIGYPL